MRRYIARLDQTVSELTPLGLFLSERNPKLLSRLIETATEVAIDDRRAVQRVDRRRATEIEHLLAQLIRDAADDSTDLLRAAELTGRARTIANEIATQEEQRADQASQISLYGSVVVVLLALISVGLLVNRQRRISLSAAHRHAEELRFLAENDGLTGLPNRRAFENEIDRLKSLAPREVEIVVCDLDGLKLVNDRDGHLAGDQMILTAAAALKQAIKDRGTADRIGGDEFCVVSHPGMPIGNAVRNALSNPESHPAASVGAALWPTDASDIVDVLRLADERMYEQKRNRGRP